MLVAFMRSLSSPMRRRCLSSPKSPTIPTRATCRLWSFGGRDLLRVFASVFFGFAFRDEIQVIRKTPVAIAAIAVNRRPLKPPRVQGLLLEQLVWRCFPMSTVGCFHCTRSRSFPKRPKVTRRFLWIPKVMSFVEFLFCGPTSRCSVFSCGPKALGSLIDVATTRHCCGS